MIDPREAGWSCRLGPARLLRHGDIVTRLGGDHEVDTRVEYRDGSVYVTFTDGTACGYTASETPMRWRPKAGADVEPAWVRVLAADDPAEATA